MAHTVKSLVAEGHNCFGSVKGLTCTEMPFELKGIDTVLYSEKSVSGHLCSGSVVARINQIKAVAVTGVFGGILFSDGKEGIMTV